MPKFKSAAQILNACQEQNISLGALAEQDGCTRENYRQKLATAGASEQYRALAKQRKLAKRNARLLQQIIYFESNTAMKKRCEDADAAARVLIKRCVEQKVAISRLAKLDNRSPNSYIFRLQSAGLYQEYKQKMGISPHYSEKRIKQGVMLFARCQKLGLTIRELAKKDGRVSLSVYNDLLAATGVYQEYLQWARQLKLLRLKKQIQTLSQQNTTNGKFDDQ